MLGSLVLITMCGLVFICTLFALRESPLSTVRFPLAVCVALLSVLGLRRVFSVSSVEGNWQIEVVLIPYAALALALLAVLLMIALTWVSNQWRSMTDDKIGDMERRRRLDRSKREGNRKVEERW